jgi:hypothetical protein
MKSRPVYSIPDAVLDLVLRRWPHLAREVGQLRRATAPHRIHGLERQVAAAVIAGNGACPLSAGDRWRLEFCARGQRFGGDPAGVRAARATGSQGGRIAARHLSEKEKQQRAQHAALAIGPRQRRERARQAARARWQKEGDRP